MTSLRTFVYILIEHDQILASKHQSLKSHERAVVGVPAIGAGPVLVHAGFERRTNEGARTSLVPLSTEFGSLLQLRNQAEWLATRCQFVPSGPSAGGTHSGRNRLGPRRSTQLHTLQSARPT